MYKGLPITTNQLPVDERKGIPHHLIDFIDLDQTTWRVNRFIQESLKVIEEIRARGKLPILVGGTHYYTQSVLFHEPLVAEIGSDPEPVETKSRDGSPTPAEWPILDASNEEILQKLWEVDPLMASRWHPKDTRKIRRSLEIYLQTGRKASEIYEEQRQTIKSSLRPVDGQSPDREADENSAPQLGQSRFPTLVFWTHSDKKILRERLNNRVDNMVDEGLVAEAETQFKYLRDNEARNTPVDRTRGIWISIGFKELEPYINKLCSAQATSTQELEVLKSSCMEAVKSATRQYARQQVTWINHKFWKALLVAGTTQRFYLLDSSDINAWDTAVRQPAEDIAGKFLAGETCPDPAEISTVAKEILGSREDITPYEKPLTELLACKLCGVGGLTEEQLEVHIRGRRHRRAIKSAEKRAHRDAYFQRSHEEARRAKDAPENAQNDTISS